MKLLALPTSPYSARVLVQVYEKGLDLDVVHPAPGQTVAEHAAANPFRRIPVLVTGTGTVIESTAIQEYLEDVCPEPSLRPADPLAAARMRGFVRAVDHYLFPVLLRLRALGDDRDDLPGILASLGPVLDALQQLMDGEDYVCSGRLTLADCTLVPAWYYLERFLTGFGQPPARTGRPVLERWWETVNRHDSVRRVTSEIEQAVRQQGQ